MRRERECVWGGTIPPENQQAFEGFFCGLFAIETEILIHDIGIALSLPGTGEIASCPEKPRFQQVTGFS